MLNLKRSFFVFVFILFYMGNNSLVDAGEIERIYFNQCWVEEDRDDLNVASFSDIKTFKINKEYIVKQQISPFLSKNGIVESTLKKSYLFCSSTGSFLVFSIQAEDQSYCVWLDLNPADSKAKINLYGIDGIEKNKNSACFGYIPGKLLIKINTQKTVEDLENLFFEIGLDEAVLSKVMLRENLYVVHFKLEYQFKMDRIKQTMLNFDRGVIIKYIDLDRHYQSSGEFKELTFLD